MILKRIDTFLNTPTPSNALVISTKWHLGFMKSVCWVWCSRIVFVGLTPGICFNHDDVIKWKNFPLYWPFVRGIHRTPVNSPHKGQWRGALMFSFICAWMNGSVNSREAGDLRRHRAYYDVIEVQWSILATRPIINDITYTITMTNAVYRSKYELTNHNTYLVLTDELCAVCCE